jgi:hypothetical protein
MERLVKQATGADKVKALGCRRASALACFVNETNRLHHLDLLVSAVWKVRLIKGNNEHH